MFVEFFFGRLNKTWPLKQNIVGMAETKVKRDDVTM